MKKKIAVTTTYYTKKYQFILQQIPKIVENIYINHFSNNLFEPRKSCIKQFTSSNLQIGLVFIPGKLNKPNQTKCITVKDQDGYAFDEHCWVVCDGVSADNVKPYLIGTNKKEVIKEFECETRKLARFLSLTLKTVVSMYIKTIKEQDKNEQTFSLCLKELDTLIKVTTDYTTSKMKSFNKQEPFKGNEQVSPTSTVLVVTKFNENNIIIKYIGDPKIKNKAISSSSFTIVWFFEIIKYVQSSSSVSVPSLPTIR